VGAKKIGILTGGGDVPGLNASSRRWFTAAAGLVRSHRPAARLEALTHLNFEDPASVSRYVLPLNRDNTRTIDRTGARGCTVRARIL